MKRATITGLGLLAVAAPILASVMAGPVLIGRPEPRDPQSLCPAARPVPSTVMVVDRTDPLPAADLVRLQRVLRELAKSLVEDERLSIFMIDGQPVTSLRPIFSVCRPRDGKGANPLYENPRLLREEFARRFEEPLERAANSLIRTAQASTTPIFETLKAISDRPELSRNGMPRRLFIFSNMMANMPGYSHYRHRMDYPQFADSPYGRTVKLDLSEVRVVVILVANVSLRSQRSVEAHLAFWSRYFDAAGAASVTIER